MIKKEGSTENSPELGFCLVEFWTLYSCQHATTKTIKLFCITLDYIQ